MRKGGSSFRKPMSCLLPQQPRNPSFLFSFFLFFWGVCGRLVCRLDMPLGFTDQVQYNLGVWGSFLLLFPGFAVRSVIRGHSTTITKHQYAWLNPRRTFAACRPLRSTRYEYSGNSGTPSPRACTHLQLRELKQAFTGDYERVGGGLFFFQDADGVVLSAVVEV